MLDSGGHLKVAGFGLISFAKLSSDKSKILNHGAHIDPSSKSLIPSGYPKEVRAYDVHKTSRFLRNFDTSIK